MSRSPSEPELATVRTEALRAGRSAARLRVRIRLAVRLTAVLLLVGLVNFLSISWGAGWPQAALRTVLTGLCLAAGGIIVRGSVLPIATFYRGCRGVALRRRLSCLPASDRALVLSDAPEACADSQALVVSLRRSLRVPAEVCPGPPSFGRGDEVTAGVEGG
jgi:hypothetical protein